MHARRNQCLEWLKVAHSSISLPIALLWLPHRHQREHSNRKMYPEQGHSQNDWARCSSAMFQDGCGACSSRTLLALQLPS